MKMTKSGYMRLAPSGPQVGRFENPTTPPLNPVNWDPGCVMSESRCICLRCLLYTGLL